MISKDFFRKLEKATYLTDLAWKQALSGEPDQVSQVLDYLEPEVISNITSEGTLFRLLSATFYDKLVHNDQIDIVKKACRDRLMVLAGKQSKWLKHQQTLFILFFMAEMLLLAFGLLTVGLIAFSEKFDAVIYVPPYALEYTCSILIAFIGVSDFRQLRKRLTSLERPFYFRDNVLKGFIIVGGVVALFTLPLLFELMTSEGGVGHIYLLAPFLLLMKLGMLIRIEEFSPEPISKFSIYRLFGAIVTWALSVVITGFRSMQYEEWHLLLIPAISCVLILNFLFQHRTLTYPRLQFFASKGSRCFWRMAHFIGVWSFRLATVLSFSVIYSPDVVFDLITPYAVLMLVAVGLTVGVLVLGHREVAVLKMNVLKEIEQYDRVITTLSHLVGRQKMSTLPPRARQLSLLILLVSNIRGGTFSVLTNRRLLENWEELVSLLKELSCERVLHHLEAAKALYPAEFPNNGRPISGKEFLTFKRKMTSRLRSEDTYIFWVESSVELLQLLPMLSWKTYRYYHEDKTVLDSLS